MENESPIEKRGTVAHLRVAQPGDTPQIDPLNESDPLAGLPQLVSRKQIAEMFGITRASVKYWEKSGWIKPIRLAGPRLVRYRRADIYALIRKSSKPAVAQQERA